MAATSHIATSHDSVLEALNPIARLLARQAAQEAHRGNGLPTQTDCNEGQVSPSSREEAR